MSSCCSRCVCDPLDISKARPGVEVNCQLLCMLQREFKFEFDYEFDHFESFLNRFWTIFKNFKFLFLQRSDRRQPLWAAGRGHPGAQGRGPPPAAGPHHGVRARPAGGVRHGALGRAHRARRAAAASVRGRGPLGRAGGGAGGGGAHAGRRRGLPCAREMHRCGTVLNS